MLVKLGSILEVLHGFAFKSENYVEKSSYRLVTLGNFSENNTFKYNDAKATYYGAEFPDEFILEENDLIIPLTEQVVGLFGNTALVPVSSEYKFVLNQRVGKIICNESKVNKIYLHYLLATDSVKKQLEARASGTRQRNISPENIYDVSVDLPSIEEQEKIASILTKIDEQIECNSTMVKKLQVLAHDSFDYFSRENNDSNSVILKDIIIEKDKSPIQVNNVTESTGNIPFFTSGEAVLYTDKSLTSGFNIFLSTGGNAKVQSYYGDVSYSTDTWCITAKNGLQYYLYGYLKHIESQMNKLYFHGTGLKHLQKPIFLKSVINIPTNDILMKFNKIVEPIYNQISKIEQSNVKLQRIKSQLLPLLINQQLG